MTLLDAPAGWDSGLLGGWEGTMVLVPKPQSDLETSLEAAIIERLGVHVEVKEVLHGSGLVMVFIDFPELSASDLLEWKEWVHTELRALAAEQPDGLVLAPYYAE